MNGVGLQSGDEFTVIIPARFASTRLPGKILADIAGKPMLQHVYELARRSGAKHVCVATDDPHIQTACEAFQASVRMTARSHQSGTDRIAEAVEQLGLDSEEVVVGVQGDEPLLPPELVSQVAAAVVACPQAQLATLCEPIDQVRDLFDPNVVKVVRDERSMAIYFSRAAIPFHRAGFTNGQPIELPRSPIYYRHIGLYAYRVGFLRNFVAHGPAVCELAESLEQLRVLAMGGKIVCPEATDPPGPGVDTPADLERVRCMLRTRKAGMPTVRPSGGDINVDRKRR